MQFQVPQFIDIEDKIFGPFTFKQFVYLLGGGGLGYIAFKKLPLLFGVPIGLTAVTIGLLLTFYTQNGRPFMAIFQAWVGHMISPKLYLWKQRPPEKAPETKQKVAPKSEIVLPVLTESKLSALAWSLDIKNKK